MTGLLLYGEARWAVLAREDRPRFTGARYLSAYLPYIYLRELLVALQTRAGYRCSSTSRAK
jgi:hypothetical protein